MSISVVQGKNSDIVLTTNINRQALGVTLAEDKQKLEDTYLKTGRP